jgi:hypothetical protein
MQKASTTARTPARHSSVKSDKLTSSMLSKKKFDAYNKASKAKADNAISKKTEKIFEYFSNEYDEYLSS